jgi:hypothetical protein
VTQELLTEFDYCIWVSRYTFPKWPWSGKFWIFSFFWKNSHNFWPNPPVCMFYSLKWPQSNALYNWCINFVPTIDQNKFYRFYCKIYDFQIWSFFVFFNNLLPLISFRRKYFHISIITSLCVVCMLYSIFRCGSVLEKHELL